LLEKVAEAENPEEEINRLNRAYEDGEPEAKELIREVSDLCLEGFSEDDGSAGSLLRLLGLGKRLRLEWASKRSIARSEEIRLSWRAEEGILEFNPEKVARVYGLKRRLGLGDDLRDPSFDVNAGRRHDVIHDSGCGIYIVEVPSS